MIQRIQSAYLLLVIAIGASLFFLPFASVNLLSNVTSFKLLHLMDVTNYENGIVKTVTSIFIPAILNSVMSTSVNNTVFTIAGIKIEVTVFTIPFS